MIHQHENDQDTETFLKANGKKFQGDCETAMRLMFSGVRLNGDTCKELYGFHDRRLRNCFEASTMVKKEWKLNSEGKRLYVEYFIEKFQPRRKTELQTWWEEHQKEKPMSIAHQLNLYETQYR